MKIIFTPRTPRGFFRLSLPVFFALFAASLLFHACAEPDEIGLDLINTEVAVKSTDTLSIISFTVLEEELPTYSARYNMLGIASDPVFGKTKAAFYTETRLPSVNFSFGENPVLDSVVLVLTYHKSFGDLNVNHTLKVFELAENIPADSLVNANLSLQVKDLPLLSKTFKPAPKDSVLIDSVNYAPHLRLRLDEAFGQRFFEESGGASFATNDAFLNFFKGFYITIEDEGQSGALMAFDLLHFLSGLKIYYHKAGEEKPQNTTFPINSFCRRFNQFNNFDLAFASQAVKDQVLNNQTQLGQQNVYLKTMGNFAGKLQIPHLAQLSQNVPGSYAINSAKLIIPVDTLIFNDTDHLASSLLLFYLDKDGEFQTLADARIGQSYGGRLDTKKFEYQFNITQHLQQILNGSVPNNGLYLRITNSLEVAEQVVLAGPQNPDRQLKLLINYTILQR